MKSHWRLKQIKASAILSNSLTFMQCYMEKSVPRLERYLFAPIFFCKSIKEVPPDCFVFFPIREAFCCCGLAGIVSFKKKTTLQNGNADWRKLDQIIHRVETNRCLDCKNSSVSLNKHHFGGRDNIETLFQTVTSLRRHDGFIEILKEKEIESQLGNQTQRLHDVIHDETAWLSTNMESLFPAELETVYERIEKLKDSAWSLKKEVIGNIQAVRELAGEPGVLRESSAAIIFKEINSVLNGLDRLEVRGRDSAGISIMFLLRMNEFETYVNFLKKERLSKELEKRSSIGMLLNGSITVKKSGGNKPTGLLSIAFTYKIAAEVGHLGDNISFIRQEIRNDKLLQFLTKRPIEYHTVSAHTRWASVGAISEANCHPLDNGCLLSSRDTPGVIHACLNGDIDNYLELKRSYGDLIPDEITTDTKIIPLHIEGYLKAGFEVEEAFRRAVNDFRGSHAILMHTNLAPGKVFLAQRGSGQALFVGLADDHYMPTSEVYGFIEETSRYLKLTGDDRADGDEKGYRGQIYILDQDSRGGLDGIKALSYDGSPIAIREKDIKHTPIHSRDIDRQNFPHYFLKEISESPDSVEKTLLNRWRISNSEPGCYAVALDEKVIPASIENALSSGKLRRIFFVGQGTAGVAALACSEILNYYINDTAIQVAALKASELSGFRMSETKGNGAMADTLVIAISQSGTTTDTNRTMDMVKARGAFTMAIVNRRDSDITFIVDGVMYTSSGRDIEMSVASTKAFYSQIVAGALVGLKFARILGKRDANFISGEIKSLLSLPGQMRQILKMGNSIKKSAERLALKRTYWAVVGSGPNKAAADEIRIKLSELCYKTISTDYVEDKKHIDLSSEPLIFVCAAGTNGAVIGDIIKDTAIFKAHKAAPIVVANRGENGFVPYAEDVFHIPPTRQHLAPILNTLVGHLWGYYAALTINDSSIFLHEFRQDLKDTIERFSQLGMDVYEIVLEKTFREKIAGFYKEFRREKRQNRLPASMGLKASSDLTLLLKYLSGRLPVSDFELDFGKKGTALNMLNTLLTSLAESINETARPIDAIKHQAKTVTVGTSRISEKVDGILFKALLSLDFSLSQLTTSNIMVLKNLQHVVSRINGMILYKIGGLNILGEPTEESSIRVITKTGILQEIPSRVEKNTHLSGSKRIVVQQGNVYVGKGLRDDRSIILIPLISQSPATPNIIEHLLLFNIAIKPRIPLEIKIKALGGKYEHIKNLVQENSIHWEDRLLDLIKIQELFGRSAEKIGESIARMQRQNLYLIRKDITKAANTEEVRYRATV